MCSSLVCSIQSEWLIQKASWGKERHRKKYVELGELHQMERWHCRQALEFTLLVLMLLWALRSAGGLQAGVDSEMTATSPLAPLVLEVPGC